MLMALLLLCPTPGAAETGIPALAATAEPFDASSSLLELAIARLGAPPAEGDAEAHDDSDDQDDWLSDLIEQQPAPPPAPLKLDWNEHKLEDLYGEVSNITESLKAHSKKWQIDLMKALDHADKLQHQIKAKDDEIMLLEQTTRDLQLKLDHVKELEIRLLEHNTMKLQGKLDSVKDNLVKVEENYRETISSSSNNTAVGVAADQAGADHEDDAADAVPHDDDAVDAVAPAGVTA